jgi:hypothetical protein
LRFTLKHLRPAVAGGVAALALLTLSAAQASAYVPATWSSYGSAALKGNVTISIGAKSYQCTNQSFAGPTSQIAAGALFRGSVGPMARCYAGPMDSITATLIFEMIGQKDGTTYSADATFGGVISGAVGLWIQQVNINPNRFRAGWVNGAPSVLTFTNALIGALPNGTQMYVSGTLSPVAPSASLTLL